MGAPSLPDKSPQSSGKMWTESTTSGVHVLFCTPARSTTLYALLVLAHKIQEGDIVVTRVARHFALGRVNADLTTQTPTDALRSACVLAGDHRRIFLYELAGPSARGIRITCCDSDE
jgi:hypothetical protein